MPAESRRQDPGNDLDRPGNRPVRTQRHRRSTDFRRNPHANPWVTTPKDISVIENLPGQHPLALTTCNPKGSARQPLVLRLELDPTLTEVMRKHGPVR